MTNRPLIHIVRDQAPLILDLGATARRACRLMSGRQAGSVLVVHPDSRLAGIFTGRDAVRLLAGRRDVADIPMSEAMTPHPVIVTPRHRAIDALRAMSEGGFRHLPVVEDGNIRGVVSRGDLKGMELEEYARQEGSPWALRHGGRSVGEIIEARQPLTCGPETRIASACARMRRSTAGAILVTDRRHRLTGIFTGRDAVRALAEIDDAGAARVARAMTADPIAMPPATPAIEALRAMSDGGFRHIPVISDDAVLGVVSREDFTGPELDRIEEEEHLRECIW